MATARRRTTASLIEKLKRAPGRFDFLQAVRLLLRAGLARGRRAVGEDAAPADEAVRFRSAISLRFPGRDVVAVRTEDAGPGDDRATNRPRAVVEVGFMGLAGASGVLPEHYTHHLLQQERGHDRAMRDFLDLFNHRAVSLFQRAGVKYSLPLQWELAQAEGRPGADAYSSALLVGLGTPHLRHRLAVADELLLHFAGHFARRPPSAVVLGQVLQDYLGMPVDIRQFQGRWLFLRDAHRTRLSARGRAARGDTAARRPGTPSASTSSSRQSRGAATPSCSRTSGDQPTRDASSRTPARASGGAACSRTWSTVCAGPRSRA